MTSNLGYHNNKIIHELYTLSKYMGKDKSKLFELRVKERLNKSLQEYYLTLNNSLDKLYMYSEDNNIKLVKKINKGN